MLASHPAAPPGSTPRLLKKFLRRKIIDVAEVNQLFWLEESGQWLENVDRSNLLLASGKKSLNLP